MSAAPAGRLAGTARRHVADAAGYLREADDRLKAAATAYWNAGRSLLDAKESVARGEWLPLLKTERIAVRTAQRAMQTARDYQSPDDAFIASVKSGGITRALPSPNASPVTRNVVDVTPSEPTPRKPTPAKEPVDAKAAAMQRIDDLEDENRMLTAQGSEQEHERHKAFNQLQVVNGVLRSSVHEGQTKYADLQRSHRGALKVIKELEGQPAQLGDVQQRVADLEDEVKFWQGETSDHDHERQAVFNRQQAVIGALRAELATEHGHHNDLKAAHRGAIKRLREVERGGRGVGTGRIVEGLNVAARDMPAGVPPA